MEHARQRPAKQRVNSCSGGSGYLWQGSFVTKCRAMSGSTMVLVKIWSAVFVRSNVGTTTTQ
jgi:hypothetical protein